MKKCNTLAMVLTMVMGVTLSANASSVDDQIESSAKKTYAFRHYLKNDHIKVLSNDGRVIMTGTVSSEEHRQLAYETVLAMPEVTSVKDELKITEKTPDANSDAWIGIKVKNILRFHGNVSVVTHVDVKNGIVTLRGKAFSEAQKNLAAEYARDVEGVKGVDNKMTVVATPQKKGNEKIDDATITAEVKLSLLWHRSTSAVVSHVKSVGGVVTVAGNASNAAEKDRITRIVEDIDGVKSVVNNMTY